MPGTPIDRALDGALATGAGGPPTLLAAMRHAVFPGGRRVRPRLCLAVAAACGEPRSALAEGAAAAVELLHCASLAHDDLPCFDDAPTRRGAPSVPGRFGVATAVLAGDALIVLAFETLARAGLDRPCLGAMLLRLGRAAGAPHGLAAGQGWECERHVVLATYQRAKTASLFAAATSLGALAAGADPDRWVALGERLGEAYQIADDIRDVLLSPAELGKSAVRDAALNRPSAAAQSGTAGALNRVDALVRTALEAIPPCRHAPHLRELILAELRSLLPEQLVLRAAA